MRVLGIDQSYTSCGVVILEDDKVVQMEILKSPKAMDIFDRAKTIATLVSTFVMSQDMDGVALEGLAFGMRGSATRDLAGLQFTIVQYLRKHHHDPEIITPKTLKKFAVGKGNAKKEDLYEALPDDVKEMIHEKGFKKTTGRYDITDAYWLAKYKSSQLTVDET